MIVIDCAQVCDQGIPGLCPGFYFLNLQKMLLVPGFEHFYNVFQTVFFTLEKYCFCFHKRKYSHIEFIVFIFYLKFRQISALCWASISPPFNTFLALQCLSVLLGVSVLLVLVKLSLCFFSVAFV